MTAPDTTRKALESACEALKLLADMTGGRADDEYVWGVQAEVDAALACLSAVGQKAGTVEDAASTLLRIRQERKLSLRDLADEIGIGHATLARVEKGKEPDMATARAIWRYSGVCPCCSALIPAPSPVVPSGLEALVERSLPSYGSVSFDALGRDVIEARIGKRDDYDFDPTYYKGHQIVSGINFNSLNRIVSKYADTIAALIAERNALDDECQQSMLTISRERDRAETAERALADRKEGDA